jgi:hypothetical protein
MRLIHGSLIVLDCVMSMIGWLLNSELYWFGSCFLIVALSWQTHGSNCGKSLKASAEIRIGFPAMTSVERCRYASSFSGSNCDSTKCKLNCDSSVFTTVKIMFSYLLSKVGDVQVLEWANERSKEWQLHTHWVTSQSTSRLHLLIGTPTAYCRQIVFQFRSRN